MYTYKHMYTYKYIQRHTAMSNTAPAAVKQTALHQQNIACYTTDSLRVAHLYSSANVRLCLCVYVRCCVSVCVCVCVCVYVYISLSCHYRLLHS